VTPRAALVHWLFATGFLLLGLTHTTTRSGPPAKREIDALARHDGIGGRRGRTQPAVDPAPERARRPSRRRGFVSRRHLALT
jgi:hypothetical protein